MLIRKLVKDAINEIDFETDINKNSLALSAGFEEINTICKDAVILMISDGIFFPPIDEDDIKLSQDLAIEIKNHNNCTTSNLITSNRIFTILTNDRESVNDFEGLATNQFANYKIYEHGEDDDAISLLANNIVNNICVPNISVTPTKTLTPTVTPTITDTPAASTIPRVLIEEPHTIQFQNTNTFLQEGQEGEVAVYRQGGTGLAFVDYRTVLANNSATLNEDFHHLEGSLFFDNNNNTQFISITGLYPIPGGKK